MLGDIVVDKVIRGLLKNIRRTPVKVLTPIEMEVEDSILVVKAEEGAIVITSRKKKRSARHGNDKI